MKGYVARKGNRWYAVIYEGLDPVTGQQRRIWHAAGTDREKAEQLATRLAAELNRRSDGARSTQLWCLLVYPLATRQETRAGDQHLGWLVLGSSGVWPHADWLP